MNKIFLLLAVIVLLGSGVYLFSQSKSSQQTDKLQVYASFYPLYFFASEISGDRAEVHNVTPAGSEPHEYEPTAQDIARIEKSNLLLLNGGVESWGEKIKENVKGTQVTVIDAGDGLHSKQLEENGAIIKDPHIWLDPMLAKKEIEAITEGFIRIDPQNTSTYQANRKALDAQLDQLDMQFKEGLAQCKSRDLVVSHDAFAYLAQRYGLTQISISGLSTDEEPSAQQLASVADFAKKNNVQYIFFESLVSPKLSETIAQEVGAQTLVLDPLEGIPQDEIKQGKDYFTVMKQNLQNLQKALQCTSKPSSS